MINQEDSNMVAHQMMCAIQEVVACHVEAHVLMRPRLFVDGNKWCALYGEDLQNGVAGFGDTPIAACVDFNRNFHNQDATEQKARKLLEES